MNHQTIEQHQPPLNLLHFFVGTIVLVLGTIGAAIAFAFLAVR